MEIDQILAPRVASRKRRPSSRSRKRTARKRSNRQGIKRKRTTYKNPNRKRPPHKRHQKKIVFFLAGAVFLAILIFALAYAAAQNSDDKTTESSAESSDSVRKFESTEGEDANPVSEALGVAASHNSDDIYDEASYEQEISSPAELPVLSSALEEKEPVVITEEAIRTRFAELHELFPEGKYWNHRGVDVADGAETCYIITDAPCWHGKYGDIYCNIYDGATKELFPEYEYLEQCLGYASLVSDYIFGEDAPLTVFYDYDQLKIGDHIRITSLMHSVTVTEKTDEYVTVMEVDEDRVECKIGWGRQITRAELESYGSSVFYITRYSTESEI